MTKLQAKETKPLFYMISLLCYLICFGIQMRRSRDCVFDNVKLHKTIFSYYRFQNGKYDSKRNSNILNIPENMFPDELLSPGISCP